MILSSKIDKNIDVIQLLDKLFRKIELYSKITPKNKRSFFPNHSDNNKMSIAENDTFNGPIKTNLNPSIMVDAFSDKRLDFTALQNDEEFKKCIEFSNENEINPMIFKIFRTAVVNVLLKHYKATFDNITKRNFTLFLRTITSLIVT